MVDSSNSLNCLEPWPYTPTKYMKLCILYEDKKLQHIGIFIKLPTELGKKFPDLKEDDSPAHITVLYLGDQSSKAEEEIVEAVKEVIKSTDPFECELGSLGYFKHDEDDQKIAYVKVKSDDLRNLHHRLVKAMNNHEIEWENKWPEFKPHVTLAYMDDLEAVYDGKIPSGSWLCDEVEIWGFDKKYKIRFNN